MHWRNCSPREDIWRLDLSWFSFSSNNPAHPSSSWESIERNLEKSAAIRSSYDLILIKNQNRWEVVSKSDWKCTGSTHLWLQSSESSYSWRWAPNPFDRSCLSILESWRFLAVPPRCWSSWIEIPDSNRLNGRLQIKERPLNHPEWKQTLLKFPDQLILTKNADF